MLRADLDLGTHQGRRRVLEYGTGELGIANFNLAAGAAQDTREMYAPGFTHFAGQLVTDTPAGTTLSVRVVARIIGSLGGGGTLIAPPEWEVALLTTVVGLNRYAFYWGEARGLLVDIAAGTGSTYCFSPIFRIRLRNTGANPANNTTIEALVCQ
jgi:hypothetical protein